MFRISYVKNISRNRLCLCCDHTTRISLSIERASRDKGWSPLKYFHAAEGYLTLLLWKNSLLCLIYSTECRRTRPRCVCAATGRGHSRHLLRTLHANPLHHYLSPNLGQSFSRIMEFFFSIDLLINGLPTILCTRECMILITEQRTNWLLVTKSIFYTSTRNSEACEIL